MARRPGQQDKQRRTDENIEDTGQALRKGQQTGKIAENQTSAGSRRS